MEYHEIGEMFEYNGVVLEVVDYINPCDCGLCYFYLDCLYNKPNNGSPHNRCNPIKRKDIKMYISNS